MQGKRVLITGGNSGIGKVTAIELAKLGAQVILACRDSDKTRAALEEIGEHGDVKNLPVNLASFASVRDLATAFLGSYDRLDVLINNAGTFPAKLTMTEDGFETQFGVNHLGHFLLTNLLLDCLKASAPSRSRSPRNFTRTARSTSIVSEVSTATTRRRPMASQNLPMCCSRSNSQQSSKAPT